VAIFIFLLIVPVFKPLLSQVDLHTVHDHYAAHHGHEQDHHSDHFDITNYYSDFLHVDLKSPERIVLKAASLDNFQQFLIVMNVDFRIVYDYLFNNQTRAPPDMIAYGHDALPLYLSTQRLRI
jgi:hypothetical protein